MPSSKPALSLCMIVRDEAEMLPGCLKSVQAAVDEIVVVDTGSKDDTPRIAAAHGAKVCRHEWRDDFSEARNASLKHATGLWVLWMDADERLRPSEHPRLRRALTREAVGAYLVPVLSTTPTGSQVTHGHRLFRNDPRIQFSGRIHEQISPAIARVRARIGRADFTIEHLGYNLPEDQLRGKYTRNLRLLTMAKEREPRDAYIRFKLAQAYLLLNETPHAERELRTALGEIGHEKMSALPADIRAAAYNNLAQCALSRGAPCEAIARAETSLSVASGQVTAHLMAYRGLRALDQDEGALRELKIAEKQLGQRRSGGGTAIEVVVNEPDLWRAMGYCCLKLARPAEARRLFLKAVDADPRRAPTLAALARCHIAEGLLDEALRSAEEAHELAPEDDSLLDLISFILLKQGEFEAATRRLWELRRRRPDDHDLSRRLAGALVKAGKIREAADLLATLNGPAPNPACGRTSLTTMTRPQKVSMVLPDTMAGSCAENLPQRKSENS